MHSVCLIYRLTWLVDQAHSQLSDERMWSVAIDIKYVYIHACRTDRQTNSLHSGSIPTKLCGPAAWVLVGVYLDV